MKPALRSHVLMLLFAAGMLFSGDALANHIFGADFNYTWVSGNTYTIRLTIYGDCSGAFSTGSSFLGLNGGTPQVYIYKNNIRIDSINLVQQGTGVEVTPVCPSQANATKCSLPGSIIQGVKRYIYTKNYVLNGPSNNWLFQFDGNLPGPINNYIAGRSTSIGNITPPPGGSITRLEATLDNTIGVNSNPAYTTIPTPFFCINKAANYNPGTVDANGDALTFQLIDGLEGNPPNGVGGNVAYPFPYSGAAPLATAPGTFAFSPSTGQLDFTPNLINNFLVVSRVTETRGGIVVGTSMREMVFVIVSCNNNPPVGVVTAPSGGATVNAGNSITVCKDAGAFTFKINPTDVDGDIINVATNGLPTGATFTVVGNNTTAPTGTFSWNLSNVTPGVYTFFNTYTDQGCPLASKQTIAYTINVLPSPQLGFNLVSAATCIKKAVFTITPSGSTNPNTVTFGTITRTGVTAPLTDSLDPGTYTFRITGSNGCFHDTVITLVSPVNIILNASITKSTCNTLANGSVSLSAANGTSPYSYSMGTGPFGAPGTFSPLAAGIYLFKVKDNLGCTKDTSITVTDSLVVVSTAIITNVLCNGGSSGVIDIAGQGGSSPYTYALGTGTFGTPSIFNGLPSDSYTVHIRDNYGCIKDTIISVAQPTAQTISATVTNVLCNGNANGIITISGSGGTPGYTYAAGTGSYTATNTFTGLAAGSVTLHVQDTNGCIKDSVFTVTQPGALGFALTLSGVLCNGGNTGSVLVNALGGTSPFTYAVDAGSFGTSMVLGGLNAGTHAVHLKDANGCIKDSTVTITQPTVVGIGSVSVTNPTCNGGANGSVVISGSGGTVPYNYALGAGGFGSGNNFIGLAAGSYIFHLRDANSCTRDTSITLSEPSPILMTAFVVRPRCTPLVNGSVTLSGSGGTPAYTYARGPGSYSTSSSFTNLGSGTYTFHIKDNNSCIKDTTLSIADSIFVHAALTITQPNCFGEANGSLSIVPSGGDAPYQYALATGMFTTTNPIVNLAAGAYVLAVKDNNGCRLDTNISVSQPAIITPSIIITQPKCFADSNGLLTLSATGGTPLYTYALGAGTYRSVPSFDSLKARSYVINFKDSHGCLHDTTVAIGQPSKLTIQPVIVANNLCFGDNTGYVTVNAGGGTPTYSFNADANAFGSTNKVTGLTAGAHLINVKDANGCLASVPVTINQPPKTNVLITKLINPTCEGFKDGLIEIAANGGTPGVPASYSYSADNVTFSSQKAFTNLGEGAYTFYAKDFNGCVGDTTINLVGYPHIVIRGATITPPSCYGFKDASFVLNVTGGNQPLTYVLRSPRDTNATGAFDSLAKGSYTIHISDTAGCFKDTVVIINTPDSLHVSTLVTPNDCIGLEDAGGVKANVSGGTMPYTYLWSTNPAQTTDKITGMSNGPYLVIVTDDHNCKDTASAIVAFDNCCKPFIPDAFTPNADGRNDEFRIRWKGDIKLLNFSVYNRYGQRIFYTTETTKGWDGTWNDQPQDLGTYFYYIKMICGNGGDNTLEFKGDVTLIR